MTDDIPEPDRIEDVPHPRETVHLFGQEAAEAEFLEAFSSQRMHHGWLITGPRGIGKATLAWRIARFLLAQPGNDGAGLFGAGEAAKPSLEMSPENPIFRRAAALSEPRLALCRRPWDHKAGRLKTVISADEIRKLTGFFSLTATDGGWRVAIIDAADEMNQTAANSLLKILEEPPEKAALLLVSHQPSLLPATVRSRCRELRCAPLDQNKLGAAMECAGFAPEEDNTALSELASGSVGEAIRIASTDGLEIYAQIIGLIGATPRMDRGKIIALGERCTGKTGAERYDTTVRLILLALARIARQGAGGQPASEAAPGEAKTFAQLAANAAQSRIWAEQSQMLTARITHARAVNLDPAQVILDTFLSIDAAARRAAKAAA